jgi:hypothetical protein
MTITRTLPFVALLALAAPGAAQTPMPVRAFDSLRLVGGGEVVLRHGTAQRVTILSGDPSLADIRVERDGSLVVSPCRRSCNQRDFRVEVVTPALDAVAITGGGRIRSEAFPARASIALAVSGGGELDARAMPAASVVAAVQGGGRIATTAERSLVSAINGGGAIVFRGDPVRTTSINGGGSVTRDR